MPEVTIQGSWKGAKFENFDQPDLKDTNDAITCTQHIIADVLC